MSFAAIPSTTESAWLWRANKQMFDGRENSEMRVALYARVSTKNNGQNPETQLVALREYAERRGFQVAEEYVDLGVSGSKDRRPALDRLMKDARTRKIDGVLVARFDRFARSTKHLVTALEEFQALGVDFVSLGESVDTSTPMGKMILTVLSAVAELERSLIKERVAMGLERARKEGEPHGRPKRVFDREKAQRLRDEGKGFREIGRILGVKKGTIAGQIRK